VFENRVLRRIFGPEREKMAGGWRRLHNEELHNLYASPNNIRVIKARRIRWARHIARMGDMINAYKFSSENLKGRDDSEDLYIDGKIILDLFLGKLGGKV
jgi:hypothetical protein